MESDAAEISSARDYYRRALTVLRELGHAYQEADTLDHLGHTNTALHDHDEARIAWQAAELLYRAQGRTTDANRVRAQLRP